jgi:hypothetical protein
LVRFIFHKKFKSKSILSRDDEIDGVWEAPSIDNPLCKDAPGCGEWTAPLIPNPAYKGPWRAPLIDNPNYRVCEFDCFLFFQIISKIFSLG